MPTYDPLAYEAGMIEDKYKSKPINFGAGLTGAVQASETVRSGLDKYEGDQKAQMFEKLLEQRVPGFMAALEQAKQEGYDVSQIEPLTGMMFADGNPDNLVKMYGLLSSTVTKQKMAKQVATGDYRAAAGTGIAGAESVEKAEEIRKNTAALEETTRSNIAVEIDKAANTTLKAQEEFRKQEEYLRTTENGKMFQDFFDKKDPSYIKTTPVKTILADLTSEGIDITKDQTLLDILTKLSGQEAAIAAAKGREGGTDEKMATLQTSNYERNPGFRLASNLLGVGVKLHNALIESGIKGGLNNEDPNVKIPGFTALVGDWTDRLQTDPNVNKLRKLVQKAWDEYRLVNYGTAQSAQESFNFRNFTGADMVKNPAGMLAALKVMFGSAANAAIVSIPSVEAKFRSSERVIGNEFAEQFPWALDPSQKVDADSYWNGKQVLVNDKNSTYKSTPDSQTPDVSEIIDPELQRLMGNDDSEQGDN